MALKSKPLDQVRADVPVQDVAKQEMARINFNVPLDTRKRWKSAAAQANRPMADMLIEAMDAHLETQSLK